MAVTGLSRLYKLTGERLWYEKAEKTLELYRGLLASAPMAAGQMLIALDFYLGPVQEFAVVGEESAARAVLNYLQRSFRPRKVIAWQGARRRHPHQVAGRENRTRRSDHLYLPGLHLPGAGCRARGTEKNVGRLTRLAETSENGLSVRSGAQRERITLRRTLLR